jgi:hypothetical protein
MYDIMVEGCVKHILDVHYIVAEGWVNNVYAILADVWGQPFLSLNNILDVFDIMAEGRIKHHIDVYTIMGEGLARNCE